jgi:Ala-tRNA(Pro) deacylase
VPGRSWAKTVACIADGRAVLAVLPACYSVDLPRLRATIGAKDVRLAAESEMARLYPGCEVGAVPPIGGLFHQHVFVDEHLAKQPVIVFNGGSHTDAVRMRFGDFAAVARATFGDFARAD